MRPSLLAPALLPRHLPADSNTISRKRPTTAYSRSLKTFTLVAFKILEPIRLEAKVRMLEGRESRGVGRQQRVTYRLMADSLEMLRIGID